MPDHDDEPQAFATPDTSDGFHTFAELYEHRHALFCALARALPPGLSWKSREHADGEPMFPGFFIAGIELPYGRHQVTYHLPEAWWDVFPAAELPVGRPWDGHSPADVVDRLVGFATTSAMEIHSRLLQAHLNREPEPQPIVVHPDHYESMRAIFERRAKR